MYYKIILLAFLFLSFSGCAQKSSMQNMIVPNVSISKYNQKFKKSIEIISVKGGYETNPMWRSQIDNIEFRKALIGSLINAGLYSKNGKYQLKVKIIDLQQPLFGLDMTVTMITNYKLIDRTLNKIIFNKNIKKSYTATTEDAFVGKTRLKLANEGVAKENIYAFLKKLQKKDGNKLINDAFVPYKKIPIVISKPISTIKIAPKLIKDKKKIFSYEKVPKRTSIATPTTAKSIKKQKKILSNGFYVGLGFSGSRYENDVLTSTSLGLLGKVGYDFNSHMGIEVNGLQSVVNNNGSDITHIGLFLKPMMPIGQLLNVYGLVGIATNRILKSEIQDFSYGIGVQLDLSKDEAKEGKYSRDFNGKGDQETGMGFFIEYKKATPNLDVISTGMTYAF